MFAKRDLILGQEYFAFLLLNLFDLFLTGYIFKNEGQEANGFALWILNHFGLAGFAVYKFLMVTFLIVVCEVIALFNLPRARLVILGGCAVYVLVVMWECYLIFSNIDPDIIHPPAPPSVIGHMVDAHPALSAAPYGAV